MENSPPIHLLPKELLVKIIEKCPRTEWLALELVDTKFQDAVLLAWESIRNVDMDCDFNYSKPEAVEDENDHGSEMAEGRLHRQIAQKTESILEILSERSPFIKTLSGLSLISDDPTLNATAVQYLSKFEHLKTIKFNAKYFTGRIVNRVMGGNPLINFIKVIESTQSIIEKCGILDDPIIVASFEQRLRAVFANDPNDQTRPFLQLESFSMRKDFGEKYPFKFFGTIDASKMTKLSLGDWDVEPDALTTLINGAPHLQHIDFGFLRRCGVYDDTDDDCQSPRLQPNKQLLAVLASRQQLTSLGFNRIWDGDDGCACHRFEQEFKNMLSTIAPQLVKLVFKPHVLPDGVPMAEIRDIIQNGMPSLKSISLGNVCAEKPEDLRGIADGKDLEEIEIGIDALISSSDNYTVIMNDVMSTILSKSPHLKRFNVNYRPDQRAVAEFCKLSDLIDLRIRASLLTTKNFIAFSQVFAEKLEILRLASIGDGVESGFLELIGKSTQLRELIVGRNVTSRLLECLAKSCPNLENMIALNVLDGITFEGVQTLVDRCPMLRLLGVANTDGSLASFLKKELKLERYRKLEFEY